LGYTQPLTTPLFIVLSLWGVVVLFQRQKRLAWFVVLVTAPVAFFIYWAPPRSIMMFLVGLLVSLSIGTVHLWFKQREPWQRVVLRGGIVSLALLPWVLGVQVTYGGKAWGPGFEFRPYDRPIDYSTRIRPVFGAGAAVPTQEGRRPLWGNAAVLLGGGWREHVTAMENERLALLRKAIDSQLPVLCLENGCQYLEAELAGMGLSTKDPSSRILTHQDGYSSRRFVSPRGEKILLIELRNTFRQFLNDPSFIPKVIRTARGARVVAYGGDTSAARAVYLKAPRAMQRLGDMSAILDLSALL